MQETIVKLEEEYVRAGAKPQTPIGLDVYTGEAMRPIERGIFDNFVVKKQILNSAYALLVHFFPFHKCDLI